MASLLSGWKNSKVFSAPTAFLLYSPTLKTTIIIIIKLIIIINFNSAHKLITGHPIRSLFYLTFSIHTDPVQISRQFPRYVRLTASWESHQGYAYFSVTDRWSVLSCSRHKMGDGHHFCSSLFLPLMKEELRRSCVSSPLFSASTLEAILIIGVIPYTPAY